jgi:hypothetical protein
VRRRQAAAAQEQAAALADKRRRQDEAAMVDRQELVNHYKHSVLGDKSSYATRKLLCLDFACRVFESRRSNATLHFVHPPPTSAPPAATRNPTCKICKT